MSASDLSNLILTLILGLLSVALGLFAIWLSLQFNNKSSAALDAIRDLANEIRTLSQTNVSQQKDFSSKMLDSILAQNKYGKDEISSQAEGSTALEEVVKRQLEETEIRITSAVEQTVRTLGQTTNDPSAVQRALESIRLDIRSLTNKASSISANVELPENLRSEIEKMRKFPAFLVLLAAIVKENANSLGALETVEPKYHFPEGWDDGAIDTLIKKKFLIGSPEDFNVTPEYQAPIAAFIDRNWPSISKLIEYYSSAEKQGSVTKEEQLIGKGLEI